MTPKQKLEVRQSERRQRLNELAGVETLEDAQRTELDTLTAEYADGERQFRAAILAEDADTAAFKAEAEAAGEPEGDAARLELRSKCSIGATTSPPASRTARWSALRPSWPPSWAPRGSPWSCSSRPPRSAPPWKRGPSPARPAPSGVNLDTLRPAVFAPSVLPRLGVDMPRVPTGSFVSGTITGNLVGGLAPARPRRGRQRRRVHHVHRHPQADQCPAGVAD